MTGSRAVRILLIAGLCGQLVACASPGPTSGGVSGDLDTQQGERPSDLYVSLAAEYYRIGQLDAAVDRAQKALEIDSGSGRAHYIMAIIKQRLGENAQAETHFKQAVALEPGSGEIRNAWGAFLCSQNRYAEADAQFTAALSNPLYKTPDLALTNAGACAIRAGDLAKSEGYLRQALSRDASFGPALYAMAELQYKRGDHKSARTYIERLMQTTQMTPQTLLLGVQIEKALGNRKQAQTYAQFLRQRFPDAPENLKL